MSKDKVLVITGASKGIGLSTAALFKSNGYRVINLSRNRIDEDIGTQIDTDLSQPGWRVLAGDPLLDTLGEPDETVLVHNASLLLKDNVQSASANMAKVLQINVIASQQLNELVLPRMKPNSSIHYVGSTLSEKAVPNTLSYVVSKHATMGLMRATCQDLMGTGIHCTCICPGFTDTEMLRTHIGNDESILASIASMNSFNRLARPDEIAETILVAAASPVLNGSALHTNLGQKES